MTRYEFFRKRIAPVLFLGMVGLIAYDTCHAQERTHATIVLDLGDAEPRVRQIDAELVVDGDVIGTFHRSALPDLRIGCPCSFETAMPSETGELRLDIDGKHVVKKIHAIEGGKVTVSLGGDLGDGLH